MKTRIVSYQPQYFPRLHYFARILNSDIYAVADYVQFVRRHAYHKPDGSSPIGPSYQAHTPIQSEQGLLLLDFPTKHDGHQSINDTKLAFARPQDRLKHLRLIQMQYRKAPRAARVLSGLAAFFAHKHETVGELNFKSILWSLGMLFEVPQAESGIVTLADIHAALPHGGFRLKRVVPFSESGILPSDKESGRDANSWLVEACTTLGANEYYFGGTGADAYMDFTKFTDAGIALKQQEWQGREYPQQFPVHGFMPNLSIIDLLMNVAPEEARAILLTREEGIE